MTNNKMTRSRANGLRAGTAFTLNLRLAVNRVKRLVYRALGLWPKPARVGQTVLMRPLKPRIWS